MTVSNKDIEWAIVWNCEAGSAYAGLETRLINYTRLLVSEILDDEAKRRSMATNYVAIANETKIAINFLRLKEGVESSESLRVLERRYAVLKKV